VETASRSGVGDIPKSAIIEQRKNGKPYRDAGRARLNFEVGTSPFPTRRTVSRKEKKGQGEYTPVGGHPFGTAGTRRKNQWFRKADARAVRSFDFLNREKRSLGVNSEKGHKMVVRNILR